MKQEKVWAIVEDVLAHRPLSEQPVTVDTMSIDFAKRTVKFKGRTIDASGVDSLAIPIISTSHPVLIDPSR